MSISETLKRIGDKTVGQPDKLRMVRGELAKRSGQTEKIVEAFVVQTLTCAPLIRFRQSS